MSQLQLVKSKTTNHNDKYTLISLFAGVGGVDLGFEKTDKFTTVYANEIDQNAATTFQLNFPHVQLDVQGIETIDKPNLPNVDIVTSGFPCQAFSIAGYRKGFEDERGHLFFETMEVVKQTNPQVVFLENVKNLVGHDGGKTFQIMLDTLVDYGYHVKYKVLNAKDYGNTPQNRERIYIIAFQDKRAYENFEFPEPQKMDRQLSDLIDFSSKGVDDSYFYTSEKNVFFSELETNILSQETVYQWRRKYVRENQSGVCPTLTANMGTGGHNVPLIKADNGIRKLTERECFSLQGFPSDFKLPTMAKSHLYKQSGNSVVVPVITRIAENIAHALEITANERYILEQATYN